MDGWCCREFCNNAECVTVPLDSCWFEWGVELVVQFFRGYAVVGAGRKASYLVERWGLTQRSWQSAFGSLCSMELLAVSQTLSTHYAATDCAALLPLLSLATECHAYEICAQ